MAYLRDYNEATARHNVAPCHNFAISFQNKHILKKAGKQLYMLYQLKRAGITQKDLVSVYVSLVRPVLEYACPVRHTNLPQYLSDNIEVIQKWH